MRGLRCFLRDGDNVVLIASMAAPAAPAWLHNLRANPRVSFLGPGGASGDYVARGAMVALEPVERQH